MLLVSANAVAADSGALPDIAASDDVAYYPLAEVVSADFDGLTTPVASLESVEVAESAVAENNGGLPEIPATEDESYEALPNIVTNP